MKVELREGITFDDVLIIPKYSNIETRSNIDLSQEFLGFNLALPIISANMDYVTDSVMARSMFQFGAFYVLHRFQSWTRTYTELANLRTDYPNMPLSFSIGIRNPENEIDKVKMTLSGFKGANIIVTVDVAHGYHQKVYDLVRRLKSLGVKVIAGNVATAHGYGFLAGAGADAIKVGIGPGSVCTTRQVTGAGVPQLTAIMDCYEEKILHGGPPIIADGGIKSSGDIVKALAAGADTVMLGSLLAGTTEAPGETRIDLKGNVWRSYRGQSIFGVNDTKYTPEGVEGWVEDKGSVVDVLRKLVGGVKSGLSYVGADNLTELRERAEFIRVSNSTHIESKTRVITEIL